MQVVNPLSPTWNVSANPLGEDDCSIKLAFLNVASDPQVLHDSADSRGRLQLALTQIAATLHERGTLAIPLESTVFNMKLITGKGREGGVDEGENCRY